MCVNPATLALIKFADNVKNVIGDTFIQNNRIKETNYQIETQIRKAHYEEQKASAARQKGIEEARQKRLQSILNRGDITAKTAASNLATVSGTYSNLFDDELLNGENAFSSSINAANELAGNHLLNSNEYYKNAELMSLKAENANKKFLINSAMKITKSGIGLAEGISDAKKKEE